VHGAPAPVTLPSGSDDMVVWLGGEVDAWTATPGWSGEPPDYDMVVDALMTA
jgi:hypothetical protein